MSKSRLHTLDDAKAYVAIMNQIAQAAGFQAGYNEHASRNGHRLGGGGYTLHGCAPGVLISEGRVHSGTTPQQLGARAEYLAKQLKKAGIIDHYGYESCGSDTGSAHFGRSTITGTYDNVGIMLALHFTKPPAETAIPAALLKDIQAHTKLQQKCLDYLQHDKHPWYLSELSHRLGIVHGCISVIFDQHHECEALFKQLERAGIIDHNKVLVPGADWHLFFVKDKDRFKKAVDAFAQEIRSAEAQAKAAPAAHW